MDQSGPNANSATHALVDNNPFSSTVVGVSCSTGVNTAAKVQAVAAQGAAAAGNNADANILVLVTDQNSGAGVTTLAKTDFTVIDQFGLPGQSCGFSNNITGFNNVGTGAYQISVTTNSTTPPEGGCKWIEGDYLGQVIVGSTTVKGQAAFLLAIR